MKNYLLTFLSCSMLQYLSLSAQTVIPNIQIHPNPTSFQFEPSIMTHSANPNITFVADVALNNNVMRIGWYYSTNGGLTWIGRDTLPTHSVLSTKMNDPTTGIDLDGNLFVSGILGNTSIFVARSTDGGVNWTQRTVATAGVAERPHMAIDRYLSSPNKGNIYVAYTDNSMSPHPPLFSRSTDHGESFSPSISVGGAAGSTIGVNGGVGPNLAVGPDTMLYVTWTGFDSPPWINPVPFHLGFNKSSDGGLSWGTPQEIRVVNFNGGAHGVSFFNFPVMAVDASSGCRRGWIYIVYAEKNPTGPDIFLTRSTDRGTSWSEPVKVNQDRDSTKDQWQPWLPVDPATGNLFVAYLDARNFTNNDSAEVYVSASIDGGQTFRDILVSDVPFLPTATYSATIAPAYMGSYIGITALRDTVWTTWNDNRIGLFLEGKRLHQVYTSRVVFSPSSGPNGILSSAGVNFGAVDSGRFTDTTIVITNYGDDTLKISSIVSSNPAFSARPTNANIPPGKTFVDTLRFTPLAVGTVTASFAIASNGVLSSDTIAVSGTGKKVPTSAEIVSFILPASCALEQNYPNPFNPSTEIRFSVPQKSYITLTIFDLLGREIATLVSEELSAGSYSMRWDAAGVPSGVYLCRLQARPTDSGQAGDPSTSSGQKYVGTKKLLLLR